MAAWQQYGRQTFKWQQHFETCAHRQQIVIGAHSLPAGMSFLSKKFQVVYERPYVALNVSDDEGCS